jgi:hypothetical protein
VRDLIRRLLLVLLCVGTALVFSADGAAAAEQARESVARGSETPTVPGQNENATERTAQPDRAARLQGSLRSRSRSVYAYDLRFGTATAAATVRGAAPGTSIASSRNRAAPTYDATQLLRDALDGDATKCGGNSFTADTLVLMADGSKKPIGDVEVGDRVVATDPEIGETSVRTVTRLWTHVDDDLLDVVALTEDGVETIHTTEHHRFWNDTTKRWVDAKDLRSGDRLRTTDGDIVTVGSWWRAFVARKAWEDTVPAKLVW